MKENLPTLAEMAAKATQKPMTPERVREICGDPCGSVFMSPDREKMKEQFMQKVQERRARRISAKRSSPLFEELFIEPVQPTQREGGE